MAVRIPLAVSTPSEREVRVIRVFDAPKGLVFDAFVKPDLVRRWLLGREGRSMPVCDIDFREGGSFRYVWREDATGTDFGLSGHYREILRPDRIVHTELFDDYAIYGDSLVTTLFAESAGKTTVTLNVLYPSRESRDGTLASGMTDGLGQSYDRLDALLVEAGEETR